MLTSANTRRAARAAALSALLAVSACGGTHKAGSGDAEYPGLAASTVQVSQSACGQGWGPPQAHPGLQVFRMHNTDSGPEDVYLKDARTSAVLGEVEGLGPGTTSPMVVRMASGAYQFQCLPSDADAVTGPVVAVGGGAKTGTPATQPVTQQDLIEPTLTYQKWVSAQLPVLARQVATLKAAVAAGDLSAARSAWLPAHLSYERLGAAYGAFGGYDQKINGTAAGLPGGVADPSFTGFHRLEYGLWHGQSSARLSGAAARLASDVDALRQQWSSARMDPQVLGVRAHEIVENTIRFELTARTDYGSHSNLATARANLDGTAEALTVLRPALQPRLPELGQIDTALATARSALTQGQPEEVNAAFGDLVERLASVSAVCDIRRTS